MPLLPYPLNQGLAFVESKTTRWESVVFIVVYACLFRVSCELCYNIHFLAILKEFPALVYISTASSNFAVPPKNEKPPFRRLSAFSINSSPLSSAIVVVDDRHWGAGVLTVTFDTLTLPRRQAHDLSFAVASFSLKIYENFENLSAQNSTFLGAIRRTRSRWGGMDMGSRKHAAKVSFTKHVSL